jgi:hypothetical protein
VVIADGRITSAEITRCLTRYSCTWIAHLPGQVVSRQSADVDYVSGATQSTDAFYYAVVDALSKAKGEALSKAKGEALSKPEGEALSKATGEALPKAKGEALSKAKG